MTGVPSIVMGLFIYTIWVLRFKSQTGFAGSLALAALMLPVVIRTTEEVLRLVPSDQRDASYALGGRQATTIGRVVIPAAAPGIVSGALLAIARAAGETAPLLFTIGFTTQTNSDLFNGTNVALPFLIFRNATSPFQAANDLAWGAALTLIVIVFVFTLLARLVAARFDRRSRA
jgi:phosphate transport system permease protein